MTSSQALSLVPQMPFALILRTSLKGGLIALLFSKGNLAAQQAWAAYPIIWFQSIIFLQHHTDTQGQLGLHFAPLESCPCRKTSQQSLEKSTWADCRWNYVSALIWKEHLWKGCLRDVLKRSKRVPSGRGQWTTDQLGQLHPSGSQTWWDCSILHTSAGSMQNQCQLHKYFWNI